MTQTLALLPGVDHQNSPTAWLFLREASRPDGKHASRETAHDVQRSSAASAPARTLWAIDTLATRRSLIDGQPHGPRHHFFVTFGGAAPA
jgi:hypothetical protein